MSAAGKGFRIAGPCHSAWGPNADRRGNSLNCLRKEWSNSEADLHAPAGSSPRAEDAAVQIARISTMVPVRPCRSPERVQRPTPPRFPQYAPRSQRRSVSELAGGPTTRSRPMSRDRDMGRIAFCRTKSIGTPKLVFARSMASLRYPLSTLRFAPHGSPRMTRGRCGSLRVTAEDFHLIPPAGLPAHPSTSSRAGAFSGHRRFRAPAFSACSFGT